MRSPAAGGAQLSRAECALTAALIRKRFQTHTSYTIYCTYAVNHRSACAMCTATAATNYYSRDASRRYRNFRCEVVGWVTEVFTNARKSGVATVPRTCPLLLLPQLKVYGKTPDSNSLVRDHSTQTITAHRGAVRQCHSLTLHYSSLLTKNKNRLTRLQMAISTPVDICKLRSFPPTHGIICWLHPSFPGITSTPQNIIFTLTFQFNL